MKFHDALLPPAIPKKEHDLIFMGQVAAANQAAILQNAYKIHKKLVKDPNEANKQRRESVVSRKQRLQQILQQI